MTVFPDVKQHKKVTNRVFSIPIIGKVESLQEGKYKVCILYIAKIAQRRSLFLDIVAVHPLRKRSAFINILITFCRNRGSRGKSSFYRDQNALKYILSLQDTGDIKKFAKQLTLIEMASFISSLFGSHS